jgi:hypothetical protein
MGIFLLFLTLMLIACLVVSSRLLAQSANVAGKLVFENWPYLKAKLRRGVSALARIHKVRQFTLRQLLLMVVVLGVVSAYFAPSVRQRAAYYTGYRQGTAEADAEWKSANATVYEGGSFVIPTGPDPVTGLPFKHIGSGRFLHESDEGRIEGHNDRIRKLLAGTAFSRNQ